MLALGLLLAPLTTPVVAQQSAPTLSRRDEMMLRQACGADYRAYCSGVQQGQGRIVACLMSQQARLSAACKGALANVQTGR